MYNLRNKKNKNDNDKIIDIDDINNMINNDDNLKILYYCIKLVNENIKFNYILEEINKKNMDTNFYIIHENNLLNIYKKNNNIKIQNSINMDLSLIEFIKNLIKKGRILEGEKEYINTENILYTYKLYEINVLEKKFVPNFIKQ